MADRSRTRGDAVEARLSRYSLFYLPSRGEERTERESAVAAAGRYRVATSPINIPHPSFLIDTRIIYYTIWIIASRQKYACELAALSGYFASPSGS